MKRSKFQFSNPNLTNLHFEINSAFDEKLFKSLRLETRTKVMKAQGKNKANVEVCLAVGGMEPEYPFEIKLTMCSDFEWEDDLEKDLADRLLQTNAPSLILSYMRPIISNITNNSEYPVFNLPYLDMQNNVAQFENE